MSRWAHSGLRTSGHRATGSERPSGWGNVQSSPACLLDHPTEQSQRQSQMSTLHEVSPWESGHGFWLASLRGPELGAVGQIPLCPYRAVDSRDEGRPQSTLVLTNRTGPRLCERLWTRAMGEGTIAPRPLAAPTKEPRHPRAACAGILPNSPIAESPYDVSPFL